MPLGATRGHVRGRARQPSGILDYERAAFRSILARVARIALVAGVLVVLLFPATAGSAHARRSAVGIESITPSAAFRGDTVRIAGNGFGGLNVRIAVGGVGAKVLSATGSSATFVVPFGAPLGNTRVHLTNPGGQSAEIGLRVLFDGRVTPVADTASAASATIGRDGGSVSAGGITLTVPKGALPVAQTITLAPLSSLGGSPLTMLAGVDLEPQGLHFLVPATLTIPIAAGADRRDLVGFGFDGGGSSFHLKPGSLAGNVLALRISHFSGAGAGTLTPQQSAAILGYLPTPAEEAAEQQIATALLAAQQTGADPGPAIDAALNQWYGHLRTGLTLVGNTLEFFELATGEWMEWRGYVTEYGRDAQHTAQDADAAQLATADAAHLADLALGACDGSGADPYAALLPVDRLATDLLTISGSTVSIETQKTSDGRQLPTAEDLDRACVHVTMDPPSHPAVFALSKATNTVGTQVRVVFWNATRADLPITVSLFDTTDGPFDLQDDVTTTDGTASFNVAPNAGGSRRYVLIADAPELHGGSAGSSTVGEFDDSKTIDVDVRGRFELHDNVTVAPGGTATLHALVAGDGMEGATVTFSSSLGTLSATSGTTDARGDVAVDYTASTDPAGGTDSVIANFDDGHRQFSATVIVTISACTTHAVRALAHAAADQCAAPVTIDSRSVRIFGGTFAQCIGHLGEDDHESFDDPPSTTGSGPFNTSLTTTPATSAASCSAGTGSDSTSGSVTASGAIDSSSTLTLKGSSQGTTTAQSNFTGDRFLDSCLDIGDGVGSSGDVTFTIANPMEYELTASFVDTQGRGGYSLTRIAPTFARIFAQFGGAAAPALTGALTAGTYEFTFGDRASNDLACQVTGTASDSFSYSLQLIVHS